MTSAAPSLRERATGLRDAAGRGLRSAYAVLLLVARRLWRWVGPVLSIVSSTGWIVLVTVLVIGGVGLAFGWQEFVYVSATLLGGLLVSVVFIFGRSAFAVDIELNPRRVVAGDRALGQMNVRNTSANKSSPSRFELPVGAGLAEFVIPGLAAGEVHEELFAVPTNRRAVIVAGPAVSVRGDQLGLMRRTVRWTEPVELFVHPITARLAPSAAGLIRDLEGEITKKITNNDISFHALRAYEPGDDRRYVHWRTSARTGQLMVRQFEETRRSQLTVMHSADRFAYASDEEFELAVSVTASIGVQVLRDGMKLSVVSDEVPLRTQSPTSFLDDTCRLELLTTRHSSPRAFARESTLRLPAPSVAMYVTGSRVPPVDIRGVETLFGKEVNTIGFRAEPGAPSRVGRVSGLTIVTVGSLADLPKLLKKVR
ncbi:MAG: DUF58 domain-containing protein [Microbacteriaceae bacterium]